MEATKSVLIVDDSKAMRTMLTSITRSVLNVRCDHAADGAEAIKLAMGHEYDLIVTDINMPHINGIQLLSLVRGQEHYKETPVIVISTEGSKEDIGRAFSLGATECYIKPFDIPTIKESLGRILVDDWV